MNRKRIISVVISLALVILLGGELMLSLFAVRASAAAETATAYSNVLDDLKKDSNFNPDDYPDKPDDNSLNVIQVAEGEKGELFVYVYQPSASKKELRARKINISLQRPTEYDISYSLKDLTWLNSNGVFAKYLVNGVKVSDVSERFYSVAAIYRDFDESIGDKHEAGKDDITNYKKNSISKAWRFYNYNDAVVVEANDMLTADVEIHSVGYVMYSGGFGLLSDTYCDAHFIAFSVTNFDVSDVYEAEVSFARQDFKVELGVVEETSEKKPVENYPVFKNEVGEYLGDGWFAHKYSWNRIISTTIFKEDMLDDTNTKFLSDEHKKNLDKSQFVIRFLETERTAILQDTYNLTEWTKITDVAVLRLKFLSGTTVYNLGTVSDIVSDDGLPDFIVDNFDNITNTLEETSAILTLLLGLVFLILIWVFLGGPIMAVLKIFWVGIKFILEIVWWIVTAPFRIIGWFLK